MNINQMSASTPVRPSGMPRAYSVEGRCTAMDPEEVDLPSFPSDLFELERELRSLLEATQAGEHHPEDQRVLAGLFAHSIRSHVTGVDSAFDYTRVSFGRTEQVRAYVLSLCPIGAPNQRVIVSRRSDQHGAWGMPQLVSLDQMPLAVPCEPDRWDLGLAGARAHLRQTTVGEELRDCLSRLNLDRLYLKDDEQIEFRRVVRIRVTDALSSQFAVAALPEQAGRDLTLLQAYVQLFGEPGLRPLEGQKRRLPPLAAPSSAVGDVGDLQA